MSVLDFGDSQVVLLRFSNEINESQELIEQSLPIIRRSVRKMVRKFDIFNPVDVVRPICVSNANGELCFQLRLTQNSDFIFASEDLSAKSPWTNVSFLTIVVERQPSASSEQSVSESNKSTEPQNADNDAAAKLVELSTRLEKVEILLDSAMFSATKGSSGVSSSFAGGVTPASGNLKPASVKSRATMTPQTVPNPVATTTASLHHRSSAAIPKKVASPISSKSVANSIKTPVGNLTKPVAVSPHLPDCNSVHQAVKSSTASKNQPSPQTAIPKARSPRNSFKRSHTSITTPSEGPLSKQHVSQAGVRSGSEYVWRTPAPYLANFEEIIESVVAGLDDSNDFTIEPPSTQTAFDTTACTSAMDFDDFVQPLPLESSVGSVKKKKKKKHLHLQEQIAV